jgi:hypothetical protein
VRGVRRGGVHYGRCWYGGSQVRIADDVVPRYVMPCLRPGLETLRWTSVPHRPARFLEE